MLYLNILITTNKTSFQILEYSLYYYNLGREDEKNLNFIKCNKIRNHLLETLTRQYIRNLSTRESHSVVKGRTFLVLEGLQKTWAMHSKLLDLLQKLLHGQTTAEVSTKGPNCYPLGDTMR